VMKSTGIVRKVDDLGRVVLPIELRRVFSIAENDGVEIFTEGDRIVLRKYEPACVFCGAASGVKQFRGKNVCRTCVDVMADQRLVATTTTGATSTRAYGTAFRP
jgi:AbrB family transcriptional regulator, transcriptional pleiotropic regulator of transition state genes